MASNALVRIASFLAALIVPAGSVEAGILNVTPNGYYAISGEFYGSGPEGVGGDPSLSVSTSGSTSASLPTTEVSGNVLGGAYAQGTFQGSIAPFFQQGIGWSEAGVGYEYQVSASSLAPADGVSLSGVGGADVYFTLPLDPVGVAILTGFVTGELSAGATAYAYTEDEATGLEFNTTITQPGPFVIPFYLTTPLYYPDEVLFYTTTYLSISGGPGEIDLDPFVGATYGSPPPYDTPEPSSIILATSAFLAVDFVYLGRRRTYGRAACG